MKVYRSGLVALLLAVALTFGMSAVADASATLGTIDPAGDGSYKALMENTDLGAATTINFGKFTTQSSKNISITNTELRGYAWGEGIGWIVMNCADTTSGCSGTNSNFKVANTNNGLLSGYAWGENAGWINFGPFTNPAISTVKITAGEFGGTLGDAGYAWAQNYGWIKFDCGSAASCVKTDWGVGPTDGGGSTPACRDGNDNDTDGLIDFPADPGCENRDDTSEVDLPVLVYQCNDNIDNDGDGLVDLSDPGCATSVDNSEINDTTVTYQCSDNIDNDGDGLTDYPSDPGCATASDNNEIDPVASLSQCDDNIDNDGDGLTDYPDDSGCTSLTDDDEFNIPIDFCETYPADPSCREPSFCETNPNDPSCEYREFCDEYPNDPSCREGSTYCQTYPELCIPPKGPTKIQVITTTALGTLKDISTSTVGAVIKVGGVVAAGTASAVAFLIANPFSLYDIFLLLARLWSLLLVALGVRKKSKPWGTVYDSITKQPIDPAYVVLYDMAGNEVATSITDIDGRYGFAVPAGTYTIMANKTNYEFPSKKLAGKTEDELYRDLYFGGPIVVTEEGGIIGKNIPLDQLNFDWNEYAKNEQHRLRMYHRRDLIVARISNIAFTIGFIITGVSVFVVPSTFNIVLMAIYLILALARISGFQVRPKGSVADTATNRPLPFSVVRVVSNATNREVLHKVADKMGNYYALIANGDYRVVIDRKNSDQSYTPVSVPDPVEVKKGYLKRDFKI